MKCANEQQSAPSKSWVQTTMPNRVDPDTDQYEYVQALCLAKTLIGPWN